MNVDKYRMNQLSRADSRRRTGSRYVPSVDPRQMENQSCPPRNPFGKLAEGKNGSCKKVGISENDKGTRRRRNTTRGNRRKALKI